MKILLNALALLVLLFLGACSSSKKKEEPVVKRTFSKDYVVKDSSHEVLPKWIEDKSILKQMNQDKDFRYFVSEGDSDSKRLCQRSSEVRAKAAIAQEISQFIKTRYTEATQGGSSEEISQYIEEQLAQEAQAFIVGAQISENYWEQRSYKESLGAKYDRSTFNCSSLIKMKNDDLSEAIKAAKSKLLNKMAKPEVKEKAQQLLKGIENEFDQI